MLKMFATLLLLAVASLASAADLKPLGRYSNVASTDGEHCKGQSISLWKHGHHFIGLFDVHDGLCGDPPCQAFRWTPQTKSGSDVEFNARVRDKPYRFKGRIAKDMLTGKLNQRSTALMRDGLESSAQHDTDFAAWCAFWDGVPRCSGVMQVCR